MCVWVTRPKRWKVAKDEVDYISQGPEVPSTSSSQYHGAAVCLLWWRERANVKQTEVFFVLRKCSAVQCAHVSVDSIRAKSSEINYITALQGKEKGEINFREHFLSGKGDNVNVERLYCFGFCTD